MHGFIFVNYRDTEFVDYHPGDFGNLEIMNHIVANKAGSVPGNITGIFDSSKHQVNLYCENHIQLAMFLHGKSCYTHFPFCKYRLLEELLSFTSWKMTWVPETIQGRRYIFLGHILKVSLQLKNLCMFMIIL